MENKDSGNNLENKIKFSPKSFIPFGIGAYFLYKNNKNKSIEAWDKFIGLYPKDMRGCLYTVYQAATLELVMLPSFFAAARMLYNLIN